VYYIFVVNLLIYVIPMVSMYDFLLSFIHNLSFKVDKRKTINVGSYRIESDGNQKTSTRPYAGSEVSLLSY